MHKKLLHALLAVVMLCSLTGCGIIDMIYLPPAEDTPEEIFETANESMANKNYVEAVRLYNKLKDAYPFSPYTVDAELSLADAYFLDGDYVQATEAYKDFESQHPRHQAIPYVLYQTGMSLMKQFYSIDRPTTELREAIQYFERLIQQYPGSQYIPACKENIGVCRRFMAEHELYIGDMFWHMNKYGPAWRRYTYIAKNFPDVKDVAEHASAKSVAAYREYSIEENKLIREDREGTWKTWFRKWL